MKTACWNRHYRRYLWMISVVIMIITFLFLRCGKNIKPEDRMEGFRDSVLRVYITTPDCSSGKKIGCRQDEVFLLASSKRAKLLLESHIRLNTRDSAAAQKLIEAIPRQLGAGAIFFHKCAEDECEAFIDYEIAELLKTIKTGQTSQTDEPE